MGETWVKDSPKGPTPHACNVPLYQFSLPLSHEGTNALNPGTQAPSCYKLPDIPFPRQSPEQP